MKLKITLRRAIIFFLFLLFATSGMLLPEDSTAEAQRAFFLIWLAPVPSGKRQIHVTIVSAHDVAAQVAHLSAQVDRRRRVSVDHLYRAAADP